MLTPQDLQEVSFEKARIGGYVMKSVDDFLEPLMEDYLTLYKENAVLKSKMRLLVGRLEEYRNAEAEMKAAMENTEKTCNEMIAQARRRSAELVSQAEESAKTRSVDTDAALTAEQEKLARAKETTAAYIAAVEAQLAKQQRALEAIKSVTGPAAEQPVKAARRAYDFESESDVRRSSPDRIAAQIERNVGKLTNSIPNPDLSATTRVMPTLEIERRANEKFSDLQFGKNYNP